MKILLPLFLASLVVLSSAHASNSQDTLDKLRAAMKHVIDGKTLTGASDPNASYQMQMLYQQTGQIRSHLEQGDPQFMQQVLGQVSMAFSSPAIAELADKAQEELTQQQADQQKQFIEATEKTINDVVATAIKAGKASEIDPLLNELPKRNESRYNSSPVIQEEMNRLQSAQNFLTKWQDYVQGRETGNFEKQRQALSEMANYVQYQSFVPRSKLLDLLSQVEDAKNGGAGQAVSDPKTLQHTMDSLLDGILQAKSVAELDSPAGKFRDFRTTNYSNLSSNSVLQQEGNEIASFLEVWQRFLTAFDHGQYNSAPTIIENYLSQGMNNQSLPKGKIIAAVDKVRSVAGTSLDASVALVRGIKTLDEVQAALAGWGNQNSNLGQNSPPLIQGLSGLNEIYRQLKAGLPYSGRIPAPMSYPAVYPNDLSELAPLKAQLILYAAPRILGLGEETAPHAGETASDFLHRLIEEAKKTGDSERIDAAQQFLTDVEAGDLKRQDDTNISARYEVIAGRMESGGLYSLAVFYYVLAMRDAPKDYPVDHLREALEKIKKEQPKDYEAGQENFVANATNSAPGAYLPNPMSLFNSDPSIRQMSPQQRMQMMRSMYLGMNPSPTPAVPGKSAIKTDVLRH
ncbi:MAG: hypothetical protein QM796_16955 [Chthoniobacteraceae bacterium]